MRTLKVNKIEIDKDSAKNIPLVYISKFDPFHQNDLRELLDYGVMYEYDLSYEERFENYVKVLSGVKSDVYAIIDWVDKVEGFFGQLGSGGFRAEAEGLFDVLDAEAKRWSKDVVSYADFKGTEPKFSEHTRTVGAMQKLGMVLARMDVSVSYMMSLIVRASERVKAIEEIVQEKDSEVFAGYLDMKVEEWNRLSEKIRQEAVKLYRDEDTLIKESRDRFGNGS